MKPRKRRKRKKKRKRKRRKRLKRNRGFILDNSQIADLLNKIGTLLQISGANVFRVRAYDRAADTIKSFETPLSKYVRDNSLTSIDGIGKGLAGEIQAILTKGFSPELESLLEEYPESLFEIVDVPGIGPKKVKFLFEEAGISSLEDLERAARGGSLATMKGFGRKTVKNIIEGIELKKQAMGKVSIGIALPAARSIEEKLQNLKSAKAFSQTGSLRRRKSTIEKPSFLISTETPEKLQKELSEIFKVSPASNHDTIELEEGGVTFILKTVSPGNWGSRLVQETGGSNHLEALEKISLQKQGSGIFDEEIKAFEKEKDLYESLGLPLIPPELREEAGDVELIAKEGLPSLINREDLKGDLQMHSTWSDGGASIEEMVKKAISLGYEYIAITDHSKSLVIANGLDADRIKGQHEEIDRINKKYEGRFKIFKASEVDIMTDGSLDYPDDLLQSLDFVLASVHSSMKMEEEKMTARVVKAIKNPYVHCLAHPSGRLIGRRREFDMDWDEIFKALMETGTAVEINAHPSRLDLNDKRCRIAKSMGIPIFINTDAHSPNGLELIEYGVYTARRGLLSPADVVNTRTALEMEKWLLETRERKITLLS